MPNVSALHDFKTNNGDDVIDLSMERPVLLIFLRHFGCIFCREALKDVSERIDAWTASGSEVVLVHMSDNKTAEAYFKEYEIPEVSHISDPSTELYAQFGLAKGTPSQLFGLKTVIRGFEVSKERQLPIYQRKIGDGFQMPGIFLINNGQAVYRFIHKTISDRPDYDHILELNLQLKKT